MSDKLIATLKKLDVKNDAHWTTDGLPQVEVVRLMASNFSLTREAITAAYPGFSRTVTEPPVVAPVVLTPIVPPLETSDATSSANQTAGISSSEGESKSEKAKFEQTSVDAARARLAAAEKTTLEALAEKKQAEQELDKVIVETGADKKETLQDHLALYFQRQNEARLKRASHIDLLKLHGVKLSDLLPQKAMIDKAFERKNKRGGQRPTRPSVK